MSTILKIEALADVIFELTAFGTHLETPRPILATEVNILVKDNQRKSNFESFTTENGVYIDVSVGHVVDLTSI